MVKKSNVSKYLSMIGARGGAKRKQHPDRSILAREAARIRWASKRLSLDRASQRPNEEIAENKV